ncbi:DUF2058 domain-containing protein [Alteromonas sp. a30]|nr:DUF2058 domain-containing protein [Alteromonas sp. a30]
MSLSLQEQLLKAGLGDKKKAQKINKDKRKKNKIARTQKKVVVDEAKLSVEKQLAEKKERDRALSLSAKEEAEKKAIVYQIKQLVTMNQIEDFQGEITFNFTDGSKIKRLQVSEKIQSMLQRGKLAIAKEGDGYAIIPMQAAEKILERDENNTVVYTEHSNKNEAATEEDDWYADFKVPDDLMW